MEKNTNPQANAAYEAAVDKLRDEIAKETGQTNAAMVGEILHGLLRLRPELAEKILADDKTIAGAADAMKAEVKKRTHGRDGGMHIFEGMRIVLGYYGIEGVDNSAILNASAMMFMGGSAAMEMPVAAAPAPEPKKEPASSADEFDLDALLAATGGKD